MKKVISVPVEKENIRRIEFKNPDGKPYSVYRLYAPLLNYPADEFPDNNNPRSHDLDSKKNSTVTKNIRETLLGSPEVFHLMNKGSLVIAKDAVYEAGSGILRITLTDYEKRTEGVATHGMADGATTNYVIKDVQKVGGNEDALKAARIHLEVIVADNEFDVDTLAAICSARNTAQPVKPWSIANFKGKFDWIKDLLEGNIRFYEKIAFEENASGKATILDVLAVMNLFSPHWKNEAPVSSYNGKGKMNDRFGDHEAEFLTLKPILIDLLNIHDYVYANFNPGGKRSLKKRGKKDDRSEKVFRKYNHETLFGFYDAEIKIDKGLLYPVLASLRALISFDGGTARWTLNPQKYWDSKGHLIIERLLDAFDDVHKQNPVWVGRDKNLYKNLYDMVKLDCLQMQLDARTVASQTILLRTDAPAVVPQPTMEDPLEA